MSKNKKRDGPAYIRPKKVAEKLGVSVSTVWRWVKTLANFPKPIKLSSRVTVFKNSEIDAFIEDLNSNIKGDDFA